MRSLALKHLGIRALGAGCAVVLLAVLAVVVPRTVSAQNLTATQVNDDLGIGVNLGNALEGPREGDWGLTLQADFFPTIAEAGFDHVRVPIRFSAYADTVPPYEIPDGVDATVRNADNLWDRIDWVIANAEANDLYVILDLHHYDELFDDVEGERARFLAIWTQIAARYQNASSKVLFEVLNEPHGQFNDNPALLNDLLADALDVVRATNPTRPVLVGPVFWNSIGSLGSLVLPDDPNLIVSVHFYEPFAFTHQGAEWVNPSPPTPATFDSDLIGFGAGWGNWSWDSSAVASSSALTVTYDRQWAGLGFGRPGLVNPDTLTVTVSGAGELAVLCSAPGAGGASTEADRIVTTASSQTFDIDMTSCPNDTESVAFMMASATYGQLSFTEVELCDASGYCTRLIESQAEAIEGAFAQAANWAQLNGRPINVGEFGAYSANGQAALSERVEWTEAVRAAGRSHGFSMSYWEFGAGFGVYDPNASAWVTPLLDALDVQPGPVTTPTTAATATPVLDGDGDGFDGPLGDNADCDDGNPAVNPGAFDVAGNGVDEDCDGFDAVVVGPPGTCNGLVATIDLNVNGDGTGTSGDDVILGTPGADVISGGGGNDTICAGDGNDYVDAASGTDTVFAGDGDDTVIGGGGSDTVDGGAGLDRLFGGNGNDRIRGGDGIFTDYIYGGPGIDYMYGGFGIDYMYGEAGEDILHGEGGSDRMFGGADKDLMLGGSGADRMFGGSGDDEMRGMGGQDFMWGEAGDDLMQGNWQSDNMFGGPGNDDVRGAGGKDSLFGEAGNDELSGGLNTDYLNGGVGVDRANGGRGRDKPVTQPSVRAGNGQFFNGSGCIAETVVNCQPTP